MYEELLEDIAQTNGLIEVNTSLKLIVGLGAILLCLLYELILHPFSLRLSFPVRFCSPQGLMRGPMGSLHCSFLIRGHERRGYHPAFRWK